MRVVVKIMLLHTYTSPQSVLYSAHNVLLDNDIKIPIHVLFTSPFPFQHSLLLITQITYQKAYFSPQYSPSRIPTRRSNMAVSTPHNVTQQLAVNLTSIPVDQVHHQNTAESRAFEVFLGVGIVCAVGLFVVVVARPVLPLVQKWRQTRKTETKKSELQQKECDIEAAYVRMQRMSRPAPVVLPRERE